MVQRRCQSYPATMSTLLLIVLVVFLLGGGFYYTRGC
jgi:hypothetical protein